MADTFTEQVLKEISKDFGKEIVTGAKDIIERDLKVIPICPSLNIATNGGIPEGSWVTFSGRPKCGKTTSVLHFCANCQKLGKEIFFLNIEGRLKKMNLEGIQGLNKEKFHVIGSTEDKILSAQDYLNIAEKILRSVRRTVVVFDSYSSLCPESEQNGEVGTSTRGSTSGYILLAQFCRQMANVVPVKGSIVIGMVHLMANPSGYGGMQEKGGNAIVYQADVRIKCKSTEPWKVGTGAKEKLVGQKISWVCECSALGPPMQEVVSYHRYGKGIDELSELVQFALDLGVIEQKGAGWSTVKFIEGEPKAQGFDNVRQLFEENPSWVIKLKEEVKKVLNI